MTRLLRFAAWLRDSLPVFSYRDCCRHWLQGRESMRRELGLQRDANGKFASLKTSANKTNE